MSFGRYQIQSLLGVGGMGEVYRAEDTKLRRDVAIKFLPAQFTTDKERLRRFETEACDKTVELDPSFVRAHLYLAWTYEANGMFKEAIAEYERARALDEGPVLTASLAHALAVSGRRNDAVKLLDELNDSSKRRYVSPYDLALIHIGLGDNDRAFEMLERAYQERSSALSWLKVDPRLAPLRSDPRFANLMSRVGLPA